MAMQIPCCVVSEVSIPPKYSVSEAVGFLKGKSAIKYSISIMGSKSDIGVDTSGPKVIA